MTGILDEFSAPFDAIDEAAAAELLTEHWGIEPTRLTRLETERDDTYRADTATGTVTLKIAHPDDPPELIDLQSSALEHARRADARLPLQQAVPTTTGEHSASVDGRVARVLTWLDGDLMLDHPRTDAQLAAAGTALGRLNRALADFDHPAAERELAWDLPHLPRLRPYTDDPFLLDLIDRYTMEVAPRLARLPQQVIHNDFHLGNVLVDPDEPDRIVGVLDFGDVVRTARVCDLGVALAYLLPDDDGAWPTATTTIDAFDAEVPLLDEERHVLPDLVIARLVMRNLIEAATGHTTSRTQPFFERNERSIHRILRTIGREN